MFYSLQGVWYENVIIDLRLNCNHWLLLDTPERREFYLFIFIVGGNTEEIEKSREYFIREKGTNR